MFSLVSADSIGLFELNKPMEITNYCETGDCTFMNLTSLKVPNGTILYPNAEMTKNSQTFNYSYTPSKIGEYSFITCGSPGIAVCDRDTFTVSFNGNETFTNVNIILLIFFTFLLLGAIYMSRHIDYEKWYKNILNKYRYRNFFKMTASMVGYNFIKNTFGVYYLLGFPIMLILTDIVFTYNIISLTGIMEVLMFVYTWGVLLVGLMLGGQLHEFITKIVDDMKDLDWGFGDDK